MAEARHEEAQHLGRIDVVIDDLDAQRPPGAGRGGFRFVRGDPCRRGGGKPDFHFGALAHAGAAHVDPAVVHFNQPVCERQADAQTAGRSIENVPFLVKHLEQVRERLGRDADPGVADAQYRVTAFHVRGHRDLSTARRELHRIVQHVREHLYEAGRIAVNPDRRRRRLHIESMLGSLCEGHRAFQRDLYQIRQPHTLAAEPDLVRRNPRHIEQVLDQADELFHLPLDDGACVRRDQRGDILLQPFQCESNRRQRIAQLVSERRQELVLALVRFDQRPLRALQFVDIRRRPDPAGRGTVAVQTRRRLNVEPAVLPIMASHPEFIGRDLVHGLRVHGPRAFSEQFETGPIVRMDGIAPVRRAHRFAPEVVTQPLIDVCEQSVR